MIRRSPGSGGDPIYQDLLQIGYDAFEYRSHFNGVANDKKAMFMSPDLHDNNRIALLPGKADASKQTGKLRFTKKADNNQNLISLGFYSADDI